jgi:hypothetical protein
MIATGFPAISPSKTGRKKEAADYRGGRWGDKAAEGRKPRWRADFAQSLTKSAAKSGTALPEITDRCLRNAISASERSFS